MQSEVLSVAQLHPRLRAIGAQYMADRSSDKRHIYYSGPSKKWIKVKRHPKDPVNYVVFSYHNDCPCAYSD
jgi:hypothetical protein